MLFITRNIQILAPSLVTSFVSRSAGDSVRKSLQDTRFPILETVTLYGWSVASLAEKVLSREEPGDRSKHTANTVTTRNRAGKLRS